MFLAIPFEGSVLCMMKKTAFVTKTVSDSGLVQLPAWAHFLISPYSVDAWSNLKCHENIENDHNIFWWTHQHHRTCLDHSCMENTQSDISINALNPNIKIQILICYPYKFSIEIVGRTC